MNIPVFSREKAEAHLASFFGDGVVAPHQFLLSSDLHRSNNPVSTLHSVGNRIFGSLYLPISAFDGEESFSRLLFLQNGENVEAFVADFDETSSPWSAFGEMHTSGDNSSSVNLTVIDLIDFAANEMAKSVEQHLQSLKDNRRILVKSGESRNHSKLRSLVQKRNELINSKVELRGLHRLLSRAHDDVRDILLPRLMSQVNSGGSSQVTSLITRAHLTMIYAKEWANHASATMEEIDVLLGQIDARESDAQTRLGQFVAAVITLGATPLIFLTLFSQLFAEGKRFSTENSVTILIWVTVAALGLELIYFMRKRWI